MTRINLIPVQELTRQHLIAEYRELPRIAAAAAKAFSRPGFKSTDIPPTYRMGKGHVTFFYNKGEWLARRFAMLVQEMIDRGYQVNYPWYPEELHPLEWMNDWEPSEKEVKISQQRVSQRRMEIDNKKLIND